MLEKKNTSNNEHSNFNKICRPKSSRCFILNTIWNKWTSIFSTCWRIWPFLTAKSNSTWQFSSEPAGNIWKPQVESKNVDFAFFEKRRSPGGRRWRLCFCAASYTQSFLPSPLRTHLTRYTILRSLLPPRIDQKIVYVNPWLLSSGEQTLRWFLQKQSNKNINLSLNK